MRPARPPVVGRRAGIVVNVVGLVRAREGAARAARWRSVLGLALSLLGLAGTAAVFLWAQRSERSGAPSPDPGHARPADAWCPRGGRAMLGQLDATQVEQLLSSEVVGRIGCHADGRVYVVPITYAYLEGAVYGHTTEGLKTSMMRRNPQVCFEVEQVDDLAAWRSVIAWGRYEELTGPAAGEGMRKMMGRLMPLMTSQTAMPSHGLAPHGPVPGAKAAVVFRIVLEEKTGRFEKRA